MGFVCIILHKLRNDNADEFQCTRSQQSEKGRNFRVYYEIHILDHALNFSTNSIRWYSFSLSLAFTNIYLYLFVLFISRPRTHTHTHRKQFEVRIFASTFNSFESVHMVEIVMCAFMCAVFEALLFDLRVGSYFPCMQSL